MLIGGDKQSEGGKEPMGAVFMGIMQPGYAKWDLFLKACIIFSDRL